MDDQLKDVVKSKFDGFEAPVDDKLWAGINKEIASQPTQSFFTPRRRWATLILLLLISVVGWQIIASNSAKENSDSAISSKEPAVPADKQKQEVVVSKPEADSPAVEKVESPNARNENRSEEERLFLQEVDEEAIDKFTQDYTDLDEASVSLSRIEILPLELPPFQFGNYIMPLDSIGLIDLPSDSSYFKKTKSNLIFGLNLNYLSLNPNPSDNVYFEDIDPTLDISFKHLGLSLGYQRDFELGNGWQLRNVLSATLRQYKLTLDYIEDASDSENDGFTEFKTTLRPLSVGISTGLQYDLASIGIDQKQVDLGLAFETIVSGAPDGESLVQYPKNILSLNFGFTSDLAKSKWKFRLYVHHSLNSKFSEAPMNLTPFGFGLQFFKN
ncbi:MAG: hypothetical protein HWE23_10595 [Rhodobacteraceae bacterium]|nr:hypothetical protein [Paracoccaceae bacterium]